MKISKTLSGQKNAFTIIISVLILFALSAYLFFQNNFPVVTEYVCGSAKLPEEFDGFTIVQISDVHNTHSEILKNRIIQSIEEIKPDIIVLTGDFIDKRRTDTDSAAEFAKILTEKAPVYFVTGNHEAATSDYRTLEKELTNTGVRVLRGETEIISKENSKINLAGIDDTNNIKGNSKEEKADSAIKDCKYDGSFFTILLSHRPELFEVYRENRLDLVLTGHAHGGQIRLPFIGGLFSPGEGFFPKYESGLHEQDGTKMIISRGIGNSAFPFRINNRPEIVKITLNHNV